MATVGDAESKTWIGTGASRGVIEGRARKLRSEGDMARITSEDVLITRHATPALLPGLLKARAAICESGGVLSHLAILARELQKPCVTGLPEILELIPDGARLRVDGSAGTVEVLSRGEEHRSPVRTQHGREDQPRESIPEESDMIQLLQFGRFSTVFERQHAELNVELAVRLAALLTVPIIFHGGQPWRFRVSAHMLMVAATDLYASRDILTTNFEEESLDAQTLATKYTTLATWQGWESFASQETEPTRSSAERLRRGLKYYVTLNQITWVAALVREKLAARYLDLLQSCLPNETSATCHSLFLDSLTVPNQSYILQSYLDEAGQENVWSRTITSLRPMAEDLPNDAMWLRYTIGAVTTPSVQTAADALRRLHQRLSSEDFARARNYIQILTCLSSLTERKNTDLFRCGIALFGTLKRFATLFELLGIDPHSLGPWQRSVGNQTSPAIDAEVLPLDDNMAHQLLKPLLDVLITLKFET